MCSSGRYYWTNEKPRHEVDFLVQAEDAVMPIEVKSGEVVKSASLRYYARKYPDATPLKLRLSLRNLTIDDDMLNVPLYLADHAIRLAKGSVRRQDAETTSR